MKTLFALFGLSIVINTFGSIQTKNNDLKTNSFKAGESLKYQMSYGFIDAGVATLELNETKYAGKSFYHARAIAKTSGVTDKLYNVRDVYETVFDAQTGLPIKSIRNVKEGNYKAYEEVIYYQRSGKAVSTIKGEVSIPNRIHDMVSSFYFLRNNLFENIKVGDTIKMQTFFDNKVYPLQIRYKGIETIKTKHGKISCLKFNPIVEPGRVFDTPDDMEIWISNDENKIPIRVQLNLFVGSVKCDLIEYSGLASVFPKR